MTNKEEYKRRRKLLTDALRSGDYNQGFGALETKAGFCCLGVACVVAEKNGVKVNRVSGIQTLEGNTFLSQKNVIDWYGFRSFSAKFTLAGDTSELSLINLNDVYKFSFDQIADIIENETGNLFVESDDHHVKL